MFISVHVTHHRSAAVMDLKKNFEADKARIEKMKESRRFKPY